jgi:hypothetical protein
MIPSIDINANQEESAINPDGARITGRRFCPQSGHTKDANISVAYKRNRPKAKLPTLFLTSDNTGLALAFYNQGLCKNQTQNGHS